jgi:hypothetical protein
LKGEEILKITAENRKKIFQPKSGVKPIVTSFDLFNADSSERCERCPPFVNQIVSQTFASSLQLSELREVFRNLLELNKRTLNEIEELHQFTRQQRTSGQTLDFEELFTTKENLHSQVFTYLFFILLSPLF